MSVKNRNKTIRSSLFGSLVYIQLLLLVFIANHCGGNPPREAWISNIIADPGSYWHTEVKIIGIVQDIEVNPKGTRQGFYLLMDLNKQVISVKTNKLPNVGDNVVVVGVVGQNPLNATEAIIVETDRQWVWTSFIIIASALVFFAVTVSLLGYRLIFYQSKAQHENAGHGNRGLVFKENIKQAGIHQQKKPEPVSQQKIETMFIDAHELAGVQGVRKNFTVELEVIAGPDKGKRFHFTRSVITIGRSGRRLNDIELKDVTISREQASIELNKAGNAYILRNEGKTNPTLVNGKALAVANLKPGDEILIGTTLLKYSLIE